MSDFLAGLLQILLLVVLLLMAGRFLGDYMARVYSSSSHLRGERAIYRLAGIDPEADQTWRSYARSVLAFSFVGFLVLYALLRLQAVLPLSGDNAAVPPGGAFNTAISFVTNTNWQWYSGESTMGNLAQMTGLAVQNFLSAAVGMAVAIAVVRGFMRVKTDRLGNFWVDVTRGITRILLPLAIVAALVMVAMGVIQNLDGFSQVASATGGSTTIPGGPVASQEAIKQLGTNGGGFFNANAAHPFENPGPLSNLLSIFLLLLIPFSLTRTFGRLVGDLRQGYAVLAAMVTLLVTSVAAIWFFEVQAAGTALQAAGGAMEGKEVRFGEAASALYAAATTGTSTGSVNSMHDSFTPFGGGVALINMLLGEVTPGGVGSGLYSILVLAIITVFIAGLMVGRTPEYLGKKVDQATIRAAALYILVTPALVLLGTAIAMSIPEARASMLNPGPHGFTEVFYAFASAGNNNGSAFAGLSANTTFYNTALGIVMLLGRFVPIVLALTLAGALARQGRVPVTEGTLPTHKALFVTLLVGTVVVLGGLTYFPALALGPFAEGLTS